MTQPINEEQYRAAFDIPGKGEKQELALKHALDIRKFEIQLYWTRATYFWTFIAAALASYGAIQTIGDSEKRTDLSVFLSCIGFVFTFGWYCVNRGSKQWQENWENHVDLLEDGVSGPLYKIVLKRPPPDHFSESVKRFITGPAPFSVSKINQIISLYLSVVWILLVWHALPPFSIRSPIRWEYVGSIVLALSGAMMIWVLGRTQETDYRNMAVIRKVGIIDPRLIPSAHVGRRTSAAGYPWIHIGLLAGVGVGYFTGTRLSLDQPTIAIVAAVGGVVGLQFATHAARRRFINGVSKLIGARGDHDE